MICSLEINCTPLLLAALHSLPLLKSKDPHHTPQTETVLPAEQVLRDEYYGAR